jgi:AcrR family transcriptional regulator
MTMTPDSTEPRFAPSLRERKLARTKHALLRAALERLRSKNLDEITVKELCEEVEVSEATFFNYFPKKDDLLVYFIRLWTIEVDLHARRRVGEGAGLAYIEEVFRYTGQRLGDHPRLMLEVIAHMTRACPGVGCAAAQSPPELTLAERLQAFPEQAGECSSATPGLYELFAPPLRRAIALGELPPGADIDAASLSLLSIFFGVPLLLCTRQPSRVASNYERQLHVLWSGLRARAQPSA